MVCSVEKNEAWGKSVVVVIAATATGIAMLACGGATDPSSVSSSSSSSSTSSSSSGTVPPTEPSDIPPTDPQTEPGQIGGGGGGGDRVCPFPRPADNSACDLSIHNEECSWGSSPDCPDTYRCVDGAWTLISSVTCPTPTPSRFCPFPAPPAGSSCMPGVHWDECSYGASPDCPTDLFTCDQATGTWTHTALTCP